MYLQGAATEIDIFGPKWQLEKREKRKDLNGSEMVKG